MSYLEQNVRTQTTRTTNLRLLRIRIQIELSGGLKAQGVDHIVMVSEDGAENQIPTQRYVQSLEDQIRKQRSAITVLERKLARQTKTLESLDTFVRSR